MLLSPLRKTAKTSLHPFPIGIRTQSLHLFQGTLNLSSLHSMRNLRSPRRSTLAVHDERRSPLLRPLLYSRNFRMPLDGGRMSSRRIQKCGGRRRQRTIGPVKWPGSRSAAAMAVTEMTMMMFAITLITSSLIMFDFQPFIVAVALK